MADLTRMRTGTTIPSVNAAPRFMRNRTWIGAIRPCLHPPPRRRWSCYETAPGAHSVSFLRNLFRTKPSGSKDGGVNTQAVLVQLDGVSLPATVYEQCDLATIEDQLVEVIARERLG